MLGSSDREVLKGQSIISYLSNMAKRKKTKKTEDTTDELLKKLLVVQLSIAQVPQGKIAKIVGIRTKAVNAIARHVKLPKN